MTTMLAAGGDGGAATGWSPLLIAVIGGLVAIITSTLTAYLTGKQNRELERDKFEANKALEKQKFESNVMLQVVATGNSKLAKKNVEFLLDAGILSDPEGLIRKAITEERVAVLPPHTASKDWWSAPIRPGKFRWAVQTGSDADAAHIKDAPVKTTVEKLVAEPRPPVMPEATAEYPDYQNQRAEGVERTIYEVEANIIKCKLESSGHVHLILRGETKQTMIAVCPEPQFVDPSSRWAEEIDAVRGQVQERLHPDRLMKDVNERVRITGVGFFHRRHHKIGEAPNALQLVPVLKIEWLSRS